VAVILKLRSSTRIITKTFPRNLLFSVVLTIFFFPFPLLSSSVNIKLSIGQHWPKISNLNHFLSSWQEALQSQAEAVKTWTWEGANQSDFNQQVDFSASIQWHLFRYLSLGISSGYTYGAIGEKGAQVIINRPVGESLFVQQLKVATVPLCLEALVHWPLSDRWELYGGGGGGLTWINFTQREGIKITGNPSFSYPEEISAHGSEITTKIILGMIFRMKEVSLFVEGNYRWEKFADLSGEDKEGNTGQLYYLEQQEPNSGFWEARYMVSPAQPLSVDIRHVQPASIDLSGFSLRLGLIIFF